jgi:hypothetical protein
MLNKKIPAYFALGFAAAIVLGFALTTKTKAITVTWSDNLAADFTFKNIWSYSTGIYKNNYGQLVCDGLCPEESYRMLDKNGRIIKDSISRYYKVIDTTHLFHSIECEAWCYEYAGTDYMNVVQKNKDSLFCYTLCNPATHCSLKLDIVNGTCYPRIDLNSITQKGEATYYCTDGSITIDKKLWAQGIMKAEFNFIFDHPEDPKQPMFWKGKIYSKISKL